MNATSRQAAAGAMLGLAAGDQKGKPLYGYQTQQAVLIAYELLRYGGIGKDRLRQRYLAFGGHATDRPVFRRPSDWLVEFIRDESKDLRGVSLEDAPEAAIRTVPIGLWFRNDPERLIANALEAALVTHVHRSSLLGAVCLASAVAGSAFGQYGVDLMAGVREAATMAARSFDDEGVGIGSPDDILEALELAKRALGEPLEVMVKAVAPQPGGARDVIVGIAAAAMLRKEPIEVVDRFSALDRPSATISAAALVGTRVGLVHWPWGVANDTWFAEIGRRLAEGHQMADDLPDPYLVEERLSGY